MHAGFYPAGDPRPSVNNDPALAALGTRPGIVVGRMNRIASFVMTRLLSRAKAVTCMGKNTRKLYPENIKPARRPSR